MYSNGDGDTATAADAWRCRWRSVCLYLKVELMILKD